MIELKTAKYKGVEFLFTSMPTSGGNRLIKFNYPGSDQQAIERQGKAPRTFNITAIIPHEDYYQKRDNLLRVLEDGQSGVLTHPTFGDVENVINGVYTLTEITNELGRAQIVIPFEVNDASGIPQVSDNLVTQVQQSSSLLNSQLYNDLADNYNVTFNFPGNYADSFENINSMIDAFVSASELIEPNEERAAEFTQLVNLVRDNVNDLIQTPGNLSDSISLLFESFNNLTDIPIDTFNSFKGLFSFGDDDPEINPTTVSRIERKNNRDLLRTNIKTQSLSYAYVTSGTIEYETTEDLESIQDTLEEQYTDIRENQLITNEALEELDRTRVQGIKTLDEVLVTTRQIITITTKRTPLSVLLYRYYGNTDLFDIIAELNNIKQNGFVEGDIRILTV